VADAPTTQIDAAQVFQNDQTAVSAITGLYAQITYTSTSFLNGGVSVYTALSSDEIKRTSSLAAQDQFTNNSLVSTNTLVGTQWTNAYSYIYQANAIIEGVAHSTSLLPSTVKTLTGEAKFIRAFCYFNMVNLFDAVPLVVSTNYNVSDTMSRTATSLVYQQIINDLTDAEASLSESYQTTMSYPSDRIRPNKWAAAALLSKVYLYQRNYSSAESEATKVINSGMYTLEADLNNVFLSTSNEAIWQLQPVRTSTPTTEGSLFIPTSSTVRPSYILTTQLLAAFENNDSRLTNWIKKQTVSGTDYYYPYKYKIRTATPPYTEYYMVFRLAEIYLIRAEARAQIGTDLSGATDDLNIIRNRATLANTTATGQSDLLDAILHERQVELLTEWGNRWYDLKRTNIIDSVLSAEKGSNWQSTDALYPIPFSQLQTNPYLTQNNGY
jgi:hypothetical protein